MTAMTRRRLLVGGASLAAAAPFASLAQDRPAIHVLKDPNCGCCEAWVGILRDEGFEEAWVGILRDEGFEVTTETSIGALLIRHKLERGIPEEMISCHTGEIEGYMIEGHVPPADIRRLLSERPDAIGLAVPGMPYGSPGMGPEEGREAYDVFLIRADGSTEVYASYDAA